MTDTLYREFRIDERNQTSLSFAVRAFWVGAIIPFVLRGHRVLLTISTEDQKRNAAQNRRLWGFVYKRIAEQAWVNGEQFPAEVWHEHFARKHGVMEEMVLPTGEIITRRKSTTEMLVGEFADYMTAVECEAAMEHGVQFEQ